MDEKKFACFDRLLCQSVLWYNSAFALRSTCCLVRYYCHSLNNILIFENSFCLSEPTFRQYEVANFYVPCRLDYNIMQDWNIFPSPSHLQCINKTDVSNSQRKRNLLKWFAVRKSLPQHKKVSTKQDLKI